jgi:hypothetical protein
MKVEPCKIDKEDTMIPISDVLEKISGSAIRRSIEKGISPSMVKFIKAATSLLTDYFASSSEPQHLSELNSESLSKLRVFLRVFAPDNEEIICVSLMEAAITIGVDIKCIDPITLPFWRKVSPVQYFRDNTPIY